VNKSKKIDWSLWKRKCPKCNSIQLEYTNTYKRVYKHKKDEEYVLKEQQKIICKDCNYEFWI
jgi:hypothetical protein